MVARFTITAQGMGGLECATRVSVGSTMILAMRWSDLGYEEIRIADGRGRTYSVTAFKSFLLDRCNRRAT